MTIRIYVAAIALVFAEGAGHAALPEQNRDFKGTLYSYPLQQVAPWGCRISDINDSGTVVGINYLDPERTKVRSFVTGPNGVGATVLSFGGDESAAARINNLGQVVGWATYPDGSWDRFITDADGTTMHVLDVPGSVAGINDKGQLVGNYLRGNNLRGYITGPGGIGYRDIGTLGGRSTQVSNLNASGQAIGMSASAEDGNGTETHAFITGPNGVGMTDLKLPGAWTSEPTGINDRGEVSGTQWFGNDGERQQFVTGPDGVGIKLLGTLGSLPGGRSEGGGINNQGTVVGASSRGTKYGRIQLSVTPRGGRMQGLDKHIVNLPDGVYLTSDAVINNANQIAALGSDGLCYIVCPNQDCKR